MALFPCQVHATLSLSETESLALSTGKGLSGSFQNLKVAGGDLADS